MNAVDERYFKWLLDKIDYEEWCDYAILLSYLFNVDYIWQFERDEDRAKDGTDLREAFEKETGSTASVKAGKPCSILEMMVALALRCEDVAEDPAYGDRTDNWFWLMIFNLGLDGMDDCNFNEETANYILNRFMSHTYLPNGDGGLFILRTHDEDLRTVDIWYQAMWYMNETLN